MTAEEWLEKSHALRLRHESAHYETLRLFGGMRNHALDEIIADTLGQIAAFDKFLDTIEVAGKSELQILCELAGRRLA